MKRSIAGGPVGTCRRRGQRATAVLVAAVALAGGLVAGAAAVEDDGGLSRDTLGSEVVVGYGRGADPARWSPVQVTFTPRVPVVGDLAVRVNGPLGTGLRTAPVEVAAGATKVVHLLAPPGEELAVRFTQRDGASLQLTPIGPSNSSDVYVGGLGEAPELPGTLTSLGSDRPIRSVAVDAALLDEGPRAFEALDALVVPAGDLATLDDVQRRTLSVAVAQGLDLVVPVGSGDGELGLTWEPFTSVTDADGGPSLDPAPGAWSATGEDLGTDGGDRTVVAAAPAGDGRVVATAAAPGSRDLGSDARLWASILQPRADPGLPFSSIEHGGFSAQMFGSDISVPGSAGFAAFVVLFVLLVGPVNALALRRWGRRELAWVTVPAITVAFTLVAIGSAAARAPTTSPVVRASWWFDGVGEELTAIGLQSPSRGTAAVDLPAGFDGIVAEPWSGLTGSLVRTPEATRIGVPLEALQTATVVAWGPAGTAPLEVTATFADDELVVELSNTTATTLTDLEVHAATRVARTDDLGPGETTTVTVEDLAPKMPRSRWADGRDAMGGMRMDGRPQRGQGAAAGVSLLRGAVLDDTPGPVWVTAVLADDPTGTVPGVAGAIDDRGTVVAVGVTPERTSGATSPYEVQRQLLRTGNVGWRPGPLLIEGAAELLVRFRLPPDATTGDLVSTLDAGGAMAGEHLDEMMVEEPWQGGCWEVTVTAPDGDTTEPEERCGDDVACPEGRAMVSCGGDDRMVEACFEDGTCQTAVRIGDDEERPDPRRVGEGVLAGVEVFDHEAGTFVPASDAFADGTGDTSRLASPLGEVLLRIRGGAQVDLGQRGLGVEAMS